MEYKVNKEKANIEINYNELVKMVASLRTNIDEADNEPKYTNLIRHSDQIIKFAKQIKTNSAVIRRKLENSK